MEEQRQEAIKQIEYSTRSMLKTNNEQMARLKRQGFKVPLIMVEMKLLHLLILVELKKPEPSIDRMNAIIDNVGQLLA